MHEDDASGVESPLFLVSVPFMSSLILHLFWVTAIVLVGCSNKSMSVVPTQVSPPVAAAGNADIRRHDESSYAELEKVVIKHLALDLKLDFDKKTPAGTATYSLCA